MDNTDTMTIAKQELKKFRAGCRRRALIIALLEYPDGIEDIKLQKILNVSHTQIRDDWNKIRLRSKLSISYYKHRYRLCIESPDKPVQSSVQISSEIPKDCPINITSKTHDSQTVSNQFNLTKTYLKKLKDLPEMDKRDVLDMLKKAYYYHKSALSLIDANTVTQNINNNIF